MANKRCIMASKKKKSGKGGSDLLRSAVKDYDIHGFDLESILRGMSDSGGL